MRESRAVEVMVETPLGRGKSRSLRQMSASAGAAWPAPRPLPRLRPGEAGTHRLPSGRVLDDPVLLHIATRLGELPAVTPGDRVVLMQDGHGGAPAGTAGEVVGLAIASDLTPIPVLTDNRVCPGAQ